MTPLNRNTSLSEQISRNQHVQIHRPPKLFSVNRNNSLIGQSAWNQRVPNKLSLLYTVTLPSSTQRFEVENCNSCVE